MCVAIDIKSCEFFSLCVNASGVWRRVIMTDGPPLLRVGLVGCSWFALRAHVPALLQHEKRLGVRLCAVCSRTRKSMAKAEAKVHAAEPARDLRRHNKMEQMFADPDIDAVLLVLPIPLIPLRVIP